MGGMGPTVTDTSGAGFEMLVRTVAVADPHWRSVLTEGDDVYREARRAGGSLARDAARFGRFGWINLLGPLAETPGSRQDLLELVERLEPAALRRILVGGRRAQLQRLVPAALLDGALQGRHPRRESCGGRSGPTAPCWRSPRGCCARRPRK